MKDKKIEIIQKQAATYNQEHLENKIFKENQQQIKDRYLKQEEATKEELDAGKRFQNIVLKAREENNKKDERTYFNFDYIDQLNLPYDLLLVYGGKNIGKTFSMSTYMKKIRKENPEATFMILRNTKEEVDQGLRTQLIEGDEGPFYISGNSLRLLQKSGDYLKDFEDSQIEEEEEGEEGVEKKTKRKRGRSKKIVGGSATYLTGGGLRAKQGASYKNLRLIGWDECNDTGDRNLFKEDTFSKLLVFFLSMERNNTEKIKIVMTGNLLRYSGGMVNNMILDKLQIPYDARLKYIVRERKGIKLRLLYINTGQAGELFDGVESQKFSQLFGLDALEDLHSNRPESESSKVINTACFLKGTPIISFVFKYKEERIIIYLASYKVEGQGGRESQYYILNLHNFNKRYIYPGYKPFSDSRSITNAYGIVTNVSDMEISNYIWDIFKIMEDRKLFYATDLVRYRGENEFEEFLELKYKTIRKTFI